MQEFEYVTVIYEINRIERCGSRPNVSSYNDVILDPTNCPPVDTRNGCYCRRTESQALLLDNNELVRNKALGFFQDFSDKYKFKIFGTGELVINEKLTKLKNYPESWITIAILGVSLSAFQLIYILLLVILHFIGFSKVTILILDV